MHFALKSESDFMPVDLTAVHAVLHQEVLFTRSLGSSSNFLNGHMLVQSVWVHARNFLGENLTISQLDSIVSSVIDDRGRRATMVKVGF